MLKTVRKSGNCAIMTYGTASPECVSSILRKLPKLSNTAMRVFEMIGHDASMHEIARELQAEKDIAATIVKLANFRLSANELSAANVEHAAVVLGIRQIRYLVLGASLFKAFSLWGTVGRFERERFWYHSALCGEVCTVLSRFTRHQGGAEFVAGLLHDLGILVMGETAVADYARVYWLQREKQTPMLDAEIQVFGKTHCQMGGEVARGWNFSPELQAVIEFHHDPAKAGQHRPLAALGCFADYYSESRGAGFRTDLDVPDVFISAEWNNLLKEFPELNRVPTATVNRELSLCLDRARTFISQMSA